MIGPSAPEAAGLQFSFGSFGLVPRYAVAIALFLAGAAVFVFWPAGFLVGVVAILVGHALLWVRSQTTAPGGATPEPDVWAPGDENWAHELVELESKAARWDASPWDITSGIGFLTFAGLVGFAIILTLVAGEARDTGARLAATAGLLLIPIWFNGMRTTWNPSELRLKGDALETARTVAKGHAGKLFETVPLLALRETAKGKFPVDGRMMLRPADARDGGFIGIQVQVAINSVQGTDYPYLYCVILVKEGHYPPKVKSPEPGLVYEEGADDGVRYLVVRQHADNSGGWHTDSSDVGRIVREAIDLSKGLVSR